MHVLLFAHGCVLSYIYKKLKSFFSMSDHRVVSHIVGGNFALSSTTNLPLMGGSMTSYGQLVVYIC